MRDQSASWKHPKTYSDQSFLSKHIKDGLISQWESYPNIACTLFMQSGPSVVKICPSPPLRRSSSSKLSMASVICNCNYTGQGDAFVTVTCHKLKFYTDAIETSWSHHRKLLLFRYKWHKTLLCARHLWGCVHIFVTLKYISTGEKKKIKYVLFEFLGSKMQVVTTVILLY